MGCERKGPVASVGLLATACTYTGADAAREALSVARTRQPKTREQVRGTKTAPSAPTATGRRLSVTYANGDSSRLTAPNPPSREPPAHLAWEIRRYALDWNQSATVPRWIRCRQSKSLAWLLADCRPPPSVQLAPKSPFHQALSRIDRLACPHGVMWPAASGGTHGGGRRRWFRGCADRSPLRAKHGS